MFRQTWAEINLSNIEHNIKLILNHFPKDTFFCPMVKANAYGHGDVKVAQFLEMLGVRHIGVCLIEEGLLLRQLGVSTDILVFRGFDSRGARKMIESKLTPVVSTWEQLETLIFLKEKTKIHIKFDTGMNRLGFEVAEVGEVLSRFKAQSHLELEGVLTHLYQSDDGLNPNGETVEQLSCFLNILEVFKSYAKNFHVLNSGGIVCKMLGASGILNQYDWGLRPGLLIYGYSPVLESGLDFKPAMTLQSRTNLIRNIKKGEGVSYGHTWKAPKDSKIAVVPIGYADGWHRILSNKTQVLWNGQKASLVGNICMDYLMLDVTGLTEEKENEVIFFGQSKMGTEISAANSAVDAQTITWEVLTSVGERVPRLYRK